MYLNDAGRARFLEYCHRALTTEFRDRDESVTTTHRELFRRQSARFRRSIEHGGDYEPFVARIIHDPRSLRGAPLIRHEDVARISQELHLGR